MIGKTFSNYKIVERIGAGAMGDVYKAMDVKLSRPVALKFLAREMTQDKTFVKRFVREAQAASALDHPNVCAIHEIKETTDGRMFIAMAFYDGENLRSRISRGPLPVEEALAHGVGIADGLNQAHGKGIIHRDLKPANLMVTADGMVKILDFGLAKVTGRSDVTKSGVTLGTLAYMSPEQAQGKKIDHRSDIFSLGVTLYEMLTGVNPFFADNEAAVVYQIINTDPKPASSVRSGLPKQLDRILNKAVEKDVAKRYQSMAELRDELLEVLREIAPSRAIRLKSFRGAGVRRAGSSLRWMLSGAVVVAAAVVIVANRDAVRDFFGLGGWDKGKGIAVLPLSSLSSGTVEKTYARGIAFDLTERISRLAEHDRDLWVISHDHVTKAVIPEPSRAMDALGVGALLTGTVKEASGGYDIELGLVDARTMRAIKTFEVSTTDDTFSADLDDGLARALGVELGEAENRALRATNAASPKGLESVVLGWGHLANSDAAASDSALAAFDRAIEADSSFATAHVCRARALLKKFENTHENRWAEEALSSCRRALAIDSLRGDAHTVSGQIRSKTGDVGRAVEEFARAVELDERDPTARHELAFAYLGLGQFDKSEQACRAAIEANPRYWGGYENLGYILYVLGRYDDAIAQFEQVARLAPNHASTYNYLGALYYAKERWVDAIAMFEKSFALQKTYEACANLGTLYHMMGRFTDAARMDEWALEYNRTDHLLIGNLGSAYYWIPGERGRASPLFEEAIRLARAKLAQTPDDADLLSIMAGYFSIDHPDSATRYAERAIALATANGEVLYRSALVYEQVGQRARALALLGEAIANGHSMKVIEHEQHLAELRKDPRYTILMADKKGSKKE